VMIIGLSNYSVGYMMPHSDYLPAFEGIFDELKSGVGVLDIVIDSYGGLYKIFDLPLEFKNLTLAKVLDNVFKLYGPYVRDIAGPEYRVIDHPNVYEEEVSMGPKTGDVVYNGLVRLFCRDAIDENTCLSNQRSITLDPNSRPWTEEFKKR
jgi:hypothetical protein